MMDMKAIAARNLDRVERSREATRKYDPSEKRTRESEAAECDVNLIMKRATHAGLQWPLDVSGVQQQYLDCVGVADFQEAQARVSQGLSIFESLPAAVRGEFKNDAGLFFEFAGDPANADGVVERLIGKEKFDAWKAFSAKERAGAVSAAAPDKPPAGSAAGGPAAPAAGSEKGSGEPAKAS